jgi:hypothetical protein
MRVVKTDRSVPDNKDERSKTIADTDVFQNAPHDIRHLANRES